jgi:hypothetical protein
MSTYRAPDENLVEEVFRRINSNGRYLSRQEIRQAGAISNFADLVRDVSSFVRGDTSVRDLVDLTSMPAISISTDSGGPGVFIEDVFWVRNKILDKEQVRESRDEEIVADLLATMILETVPRYASETLDEYYGLGPSSSKERLRDRIETAVQREGAELIKGRFGHVHGVIEKILQRSGKSFSQLVFRSPRQRVPRYYETIFLSLYSLLITENRVVRDYAEIAKALEGIADRVFSITSSGGTWSAENKRDNTAAVAGVLRDHTVPETSKRDFLLEANESRLYRLLRAALAEQSLFEMKQGLHLLDGSSNFDPNGFERIMKTFSAIANDGEGTTGYVVIGIADKQADARRVRELYSASPVREGQFWITGIDHELAFHGGTIDGYMGFFSDKIKSSGLEPDLASQILRDMRPTTYHGRTVLLLPVKALTSPVSYKDRWYERQASSTIEVPARDVARLFRRFPQT